MKSVNRIQPEDSSRIAELEKKIEELSLKLEEKEQQLLAAEKMTLLGQLLAGIAHEINTPLGALKSNNDLFLRYTKKVRAILFSPETPVEIRENKTLLQVFENIDQINQVNKNAAEKIVEIVNGVRRHARQDEESPTTASLPEIIDSTLAIVQHELKNRVQVHREYLGNSNIVCFPNRLSQVFLNLIVNASHAIEGKGEIFIKTYNRDKDVIVEIRDTGKGIPKEKLGRIFETGFTTKEKGMGMGLALVSKLVEDHRGKIEVESEIGRGTTFRITLPVKQGGCK